MVINKFLIINGTSRFVYKINYDGYNLIAECESGMYNAFVTIKSLVDD